VSITPYYKVNILQQPSLRFFKGYRTEQFSYRFRRAMPGFFEIYFIQEGRLLETDADGTEIYEAGCVHTCHLDRPQRHRSDSPFYQVFEVGMCFSGPITPMTREAVRRWIPTDHEVILATRVTDPGAAAELEKIIKKAIHAHHTATIDRFLQTRSALMELFQVMTAYSVRQAHEDSMLEKRQNDYCRRACEYIAEHISQPIREDQLSAQLNISANYLSKIFSQSMGMSLTEYIHRAKLQQVVHLITEGHATLDEAAEAVGILSSKYLSRLFHRYMGMSVREYKKLHRTAPPFPAE